MNRLSKRVASLCMLFVFAFAHAQLAFAVCTIDRGQLSQALAGQAEAADHSCCDRSPAPSSPGTPMSANGCLSHCTSDLQSSATPYVPIFAMAAAPMFALPQVDRARPMARKVEERPPAAVPRRILLQSFLV